MTPPPSLQQLIETVQQDSPSEDLLDLLVTASTTVSQLEEVNDALLGHFVDRCRRSGRSWSEISSALGVSKQAVHKRFSGPLAARPASTGAPYNFERFTARARSAVAEAGKAAEALGHGHVHAEHLLLGLLAVPEGIAAQVLKAGNVTRDAVAAAIRAASAPDADDCAAAESTGRMAAAVDAGRGPAVAGGAGSAPDTAAQHGRLPFAPDAGGALREALAEALELGHNYIGTEHLLLGLYRSPDTLAVRILDELGVGQAEARVRTGEMLRALQAGRLTFQPDA